MLVDCVKERNRRKPEKKKGEGTEASMGAASLFLVLSIHFILVCPNPKSNNDELKKGRSIFHD